jgi:DNA-binding Lrp family transcriptional regulator
LGYISIEITASEYSCHIYNLAPNAVWNQDIITSQMSVFPQLKRSHDLWIRILKELTSPGSFQWNFRESYSNLARKLDVDEETVRVTLKKALQAGIVSGWRLIINPHLLGEQLVGLQIEVNSSERKAEVISQLKLIEGVVMILDFHGRWLRIVLYYPNFSSLQRKMNLISSICVFDSEVPNWTTPTPRPGIKLGPTDWKILRLIRKDPRKEVASISKQVRVSTRTVSRRLRLMTESHVAYLIPLRSVKLSRGVICCFLITCPDEQKRQIEKEIRDRGERIDFEYTSLQDLLLITLLADNIARAEDLFFHIKNMKEVKSARMDVMKDFIFVDDWLDEQVESRAIG